MDRIPKELLAEIFMHALDQDNPKTAHECCINLCLTCKLWKQIIFSSVRSRITEKFDLDIVTPIVCIRVDCALDSIFWRQYKIAPTERYLRDALSHKRYNINTSQLLISICTSNQYIGYTSTNGFRFTVHFKSLNTEPCIYNLTGLQFYGTMYVDNLYETSIGLIIRMTGSPLPHYKYFEYCVVLPEFVSGKTLLVDRNKILCSVNCPLRSGMNVRNNYNIIYDYLMYPAIDNNVDYHAMHLRTRAVIDIAHLRNCIVVMHSHHPLVFLVDEQQNKEYIYNIQTNHILLEAHQCKSVDDALLINNQIYHVPSNYIIAEFKNMKVMSFFKDSGRYYVLYTRDSRFSK